ncbi:MAG: hypothetical protein ACLFV1_04535 [Thiohalophilus sp.]
MVTKPLPILKRVLGQVACAAGLAWAATTAGAEGIGSTPVRLPPLAQEGERTEMDVIELRAPVVRFEFPGGLHAATAYGWVDEETISALDGLSVSPRGQVSDKVMLPLKGGANTLVIQLRGRPEAAADTTVIWEYEMPVRFRGGLMETRSQGSQLSEEELQAIFKDESGIHVEVPGQK